MSTPERKIEVETPLGPIWFWGRDNGLPVLVLITGTFADFDIMDKLAGALGDVDVWRAHLPGNHSPPLVATSIGAYTSAFNHAIQSRLADRPIAVIGLSVGALVALGLRAPNIRRLLLVEPPLLTEGLWMAPMFVEQAPPGSEEMLWNILGFRAGRTEPRDYTAALRTLRIPTTVMIAGDEVGTPRFFEVMPSMVTDAARAMLAAHPLVRLVTVMNAGHNVAKAAPEGFLDVTRRTCQAAFGASVGHRPGPAA